MAHSKADAQQVIKGGGSEHRGSAVSRNRVSWKASGGGRRAAQAVLQAFAHGETMLKHLREEWEDVSSALERIMGIESALGG